LRGASGSDAGSFNRSCSTYVSAPSGHSDWDGIACFDLPDYVPVSVLQHVPRCAFCSMHPSRNGISKWLPYGFAGSAPAYLEVFVPVFNVRHFNNAYCSALLWQCNG